MNYMYLLRIIVIVNIIMAYVLDISLPEVGYGHIYILSMRKLVEGLPSD